MDRGFSIIHNEALKDAFPIVASMVFPELSDGRKQGVSMAANAKMGRTRYRRDGQLRRAPDGRMFGIDEIR